MTDYNNAIYRALRAAYELRSDDCSELWMSAGLNCLIRKYAASCYPLTIRITVKLPHDA
ncbi:hypothetical protein SAMN05421686_1224 [Thalassolituus maritimus]|uniref:Uncharacterized protein n=1 Tax=Thalassolituus maritimus TaxID=484498 RepID=A0A1N7QCR9_9GAMM|nr:hypothetical protein SAMN05421686_1224 [Thalassolituus maritimus]